jgi:hypothetical protein
LCKVDTTDNTNQASQNGNKIDLGIP